MNTVKPGQQGTASQLSSLIDNINERAIVAYQAALVESMNINSEQTIVKSAQIILQQIAKAPSDSVGQAPLSAYHLHDDMLNTLRQLHIKRRLMAEDAEAKLS